MRFYWAGWILGGAEQNQANMDAVRIIAREILKKPYKGFIRPETCW
jgi:hypothetical protein